MDYETPADRWAELSARARAVPDGTAGWPGLKAARRRCGLTQSQMGGLLGMSRKNYQNIEAGRVSLTLVRAAQMSCVLDVPIAELFELPEGGAGEAPPAAAGLDAAGRAKVADYAADLAASGRYGTGPAQSGMPRSSISSASRTSGA